MIVDKKEKNKLFILESENDRARIFLNQYNTIKLIVVNESSNIGDLKNKKNRKCRFCDKDSTETTFNNKAHSIPHFLGNNSLFSDFECDQCNSIFSRYETDLAEYFKVHRTIYGTKGKKGIPKIETDNKAKRISQDNAGMISFIDKEIPVNPNGINFSIKKTYTPINVYKALVKIALSLLDDKDFKYYKVFVRLYLLEDKNDSEIFPLAKIGLYELGRENKVDELRCVLFQKKVDTDIPFHFFSLYYENMILTFHLPLHQYDYTKGYYSAMKVQLPPLLTFSFLNKKSDIKFEQLDLGLGTKVTKNDNIEIAFDVDEMRKAIEKQLGRRPSKKNAIDGFSIKLN